jgi:hypothetical protein
LLYQVGFQDQVEGDVEELKHLEFVNSHKGFLFYNISYTSTMGESKLKVCIDVTIVDDKYLFDVSAHKSLTIKDIRSILVGAVCMTIHGEETPKDQARVLREVISHIEEDFIDIDSFSDVQIHKQDPPFGDK